ncbi:UNVERIFIED_CONTAM: orotidine 5'-phosphate decarboxylase [Halobacillus marinus]
MKLQLALDRMTKENCIDLIEETKAYVDWIEVGTGVIKEYGVSFLAELKAAYPESTLVADMKTCDAGKHESEQAFRAGADVTTVMAFSADQTIKDSLLMAEIYGKRVMVDLLNVQNETRLKELSNLGVDLVGLHYGKDMQKKKGAEMDELFSLVKEYPDFDIAVAGGISIDKIKTLSEYEPQIVIVGSALTKAENPKAEAEAIKGAMRVEGNYC